MGKLIDKKTGATITATGDELISALKSGKYAPADETVTVVNQHGDSVALDADFAAQEVSGGTYQGETAGQQAERAHEAQLEEENSGILAAAGAAGLGLARGASLTFSDAALVGSGLVDPETIKNLQKYQGAASLAGEGAGLLGTAWLTGGTGAAARLAGATPAGLVARGASALGARAGGGTLARTVLGGVIEGSVDGALWSGAQSVSDAIVNNDRLTVESFLANVGSGAALGGAAGGLFKLGAHGAGKLAARGEGKVGSEALKGFDDFGKAFTQRVKNDIDNLAPHYTVPGRTGAAGVELGAAAKELQTTLKKIDLAPSALARKPPEEAIAILQKTDRYLRAKQAIDDTLGTRIDDFNDLTRPADRLDSIAAMEPEVLEKSLKIDKTKLPAGSVDEFGRLRPLSEPVETLWRGYVAERIAATNTGKSTLRSLLDLAGMAANVATLGGAGMVSNAARRVILQPLQNVATSLRAVQAVKTRMAEGIEAFAKAAVKPGAGVKASRAASTAFRGVRFAEGKRDRKRRESVALKTMRELQSAASDPATLRRTLDARFAPIRGINLQLGYELVDRYLQRMEYLYQNMPPLHGPVSPFGKPRGGPSSAEVHAFANRLRASEDPLSLLDDLRHGRVNREAVETVRELYPELFKQMQSGLLQEVSAMAERGKEITYQARLQLDLVWDVPLEPTAQPAFLGPVNQMYAAKREEQQKSGGGGFAPSAASPRTPEPTAAQRLENR